MDDKPAVGTVCQSLCQQSSADKFVAGRRQQIDLPPVRWRRDETRW